MITSYINYPNPAPSTTGANLSLIDSTSITVPVLVFASTQTGVPTNRGGVGQVNAITTISLCNTSAVNLTDETSNSVTVNIYLVKANNLGFPVTGLTSPGAGNLIVSELVVPAGETVFLSEERIVLDAGDEIWVGTSSSGKLSVTVSTLPV